MNNNIENKTDFDRVLRTIKLRKIMVKVLPDGVYIRLAGNEGKGEAFSENFVNAYPTKNEPPPTNLHIEENNSNDNNKKEKI